jgi:spore coat polysaccharide biosynthesis protein SpsF
MDGSTVAILQARLSSQRLPNKVLAPILGRPMLARQIERVRRARRIDRIVLATSEDASDAPLVDLCHDIGVECFRGNLLDVLDRYYQAARRFSADTVVRLTGDNPLVDPGVIDTVIGAYHEQPCDYSSNTIERTFPRGLDVEVLSLGCLETVWRLARDTYEREHVTPFVHHRSDLFRRRFHHHEEDLSALRWTVDEPADLEFVRVIYDRLYDENPSFTWLDVMNLLRRIPSLTEINAACGNVPPPPLRLRTRTDDKQHGRKRRAA